LSKDTKDQSGFDDWDLDLTKNFTEKNEKRSYDNLDDSQKNFALILILLSFFSGNDSEANAEVLSDVTGVEVPELKKRKETHRNNNKSPEDVARSFSYDTEKLNAKMQKANSGLFVPPSVSIEDDTEEFDDTHVQTTKPSDELVSPPESVEDDAGKPDAPPKQTTKSSDVIAPPLAKVEKDAGKPDATPKQTTKSSDVIAPPLEKVEKDAGKPDTHKQTAKSAPPSANIEKGAGLNKKQWQEVLADILKREGFRNDVHLVKGKPHVGVGHLIKSGEPYKMGDVISDAEVMKLLEKDLSKSYKASLRQAQEANINDAKFVQALVSVNFQLGTGWTNIFQDTWKEIKSGNYEQAIVNLGKSKWNKQTPVRVADFKNALERAIDIREEKITAVALTAPQSGTQLAFNNGGVKESSSKLSAKFDGKGTDQITRASDELKGTKTAHRKPGATQPGLSPSG